MKSIRNQMLAYLMIGSIIIFLALGIFSNVKLNELPKHIEDQYLEITSARSGEVSKELLGLIEQARMISQSPIIKSMDMNAIQDYLPSLVLDDQYRNMTIARMDGKAWTTLGVEIDISEQEQYQKIIIEKEISHISQSFISPYADPETPVIIISHAVENN